MAESNVLKFYVRGQSLKKTAPARLVADTINYFSAEFVFDDAWDGMSTWAHFSNGDKSYLAAIIDGRIESGVAGLNFSDGVWDTYVHGNYASEDPADYERLTTEVISFEVDPTGILDGEPLPEIAPTVAEQIDAKAMAALNARILSAIASVDSHIGAPSVDIEIAGADGEKELRFFFHNLKGETGVSFWDGIANKPFERIGDTLSVTDGTLDVNIHEVSNEAGGLTAIIG